MQTSYFQRNGSGTHQLSTSLTLKYFLPEISVLSSLFWVVISYNPFGLLALILMKLFKAVVIIGLTTRLSQGPGATFNDEAVYGNTFSSEATLVKVIGALNVLYASVFLVLIYLYKCQKAHLTKERETNYWLGPLNSALSFFFGAFQEVFGLISQILITTAFYRATLSQYSTMENEVNQDWTLLLVLLTLAQLQLCLVSYIEQQFNNLLFRNEYILSTRIIDAGIFQNAFFRPGFVVLTAFLTLKPNPSQGEALVYMALIFLQQTLKLQSGCLQSLFHDMLLRRAELVIQSGTVAITFVGFVIRLSQDYVNTLQRFHLLIIFVLAWIGAAGIILLLKLRKDRKMVQFLHSFVMETDSSHLILQVKDESDFNLIRSETSEQEIEYAAFLLKDLLDSPNPTHHMIMEDLLINEELLCIQDTDRVSYLSLINQILSNGLDEDDHDTEKSFCVKMSSILTANKYDEAQDSDLDASQKNSEGGLKQEHRSGFDISKAVSIVDAKNGQGSMFTKEITLQTPQNNQDNYDRRPSRTSLSLQVQIQNLVGGFGLARTEAESDNFQLADLFKHELGKKGASNFMAKNSARQTLAGDYLDPIARKIVEMTATNSEAVKMVKIRYFYDSLLVKICKIYPTSFRLMFLKAKVALDRLQNKYLTLTTITHLSLISTKKHSYVQQVQTKISELYFMHQCKMLTTSTNSLSNNSLGGDNNSIFQAGSEESGSSLIEFLSQSLEIDKILQKLKQCCERIATFWYLFVSENISESQVIEFEQNSLQLSEMLNYIKQRSLMVDDINSFHSKSDVLCLALSNFYISVLKDTRSGQKIARRMESYINMNVDSFSGMGNNSKAIHGNTIDDIGVAVVDGNFDLYGRILFTNKKFLSLLGGYQASELINRTVHHIMPRAVADIHNHFWRGFASLGEPKVLDNVRFLYTKDKQGYITPCKVFIKFQYNAQFGYCFVGVFQRAAQIAIIDPAIPIPVNDTYTMICNRKGMVLELSQSCQELLQLTPLILDQLHSQFQEGFQVSTFNPFQLQFSDFMFTENRQSLHFKNILLDFSKLSKCIALTEAAAQQTSQESDIPEKRFRTQLSFKEGPGQEESKEDSQSPQSIQGELMQGMINSTCGPSQMRANMRIVREVYGTGGLLSLYYVIFTEAPDDQINAAGTSRMRDRFLKQRKSAAPTHQQEENAFQISPMGIDKESGSLPEDFMGPGSMSSVSSQDSNQSGINALDEDLEESKQPTHLLWLRICIKTIFVLMIILSCVQYSLNESYMKTNTADQLVLLKSLQSQEYLTQLSLLTRAYLDIQLGLAPDISPNSYSLNQTVNGRPRRSAVMLNLAEDMIERIRFCIQILQTYMGYAAIDYGNIPLISYSLLPNMTLEQRALPRLQGVALWLIQVEEVFLQEKFISTVSTYLYNEMKIKPTSQDQIAFYATVNSEYEISHLFGDMADNLRILIILSVEQGILVNKMFAVVAAILILIGGVTMGYFIYRLLQLRFKVLTFFEKVEHAKIASQVQAAEDFYKFLELGVKNGRSPQVKLKKIITVENKQEDILELHKILQDKIKTVKEKKGKQGVRNYEEKLKDEEPTKEGHFQLQLTQIAQNQGLDNKQTSVFSRQSLKNLKKALKFSRKKDGSNSDRKKQHKDENSQSDNEGENLEEVSVEIHSNNELQTVTIGSKHMIITVKLRERVKQTLLRYTPLIVLAMALPVVFFIIQFLLFEAQQTEIGANVSHLVDLIDSLSCSETVISKIREYQVSNGTKYNINQVKNQSQLRLSFLERNSNINLGANESFFDCLNKNQKVSDWLQTIQGGQFYLNGEGDSSICGQLSLQVNATELFNRQVCTSIYKGTLQKTPLQATSLILQDAIYSHLKFMAVPRQERTAAYLNQSIGGELMIELMDAHSFYLQHSLREYYEAVITTLVEAQKGSSAAMGLFGVFMALVVVSICIIHAYINLRVRIRLWHSFLLIQLLPRDELERDFLKGINEFLKNI